MSYRALEAEKIGDVILWDGGNNNWLFFKPHYMVVAADAMRPGLEISAYLGEVNVRVIEVEAFGKDVKSLEVHIDGIKVDAKFSIVDNFMRIDLGSQQKVSKGIEIRIVYT